MIWLTALLAVDLIFCSTSLYSVLVGLRVTFLKDSDGVIGSHDFGSCCDNSAIKLITIHTRYIDYSVQDSP